MTGLPNTLWDRISYYYIHMGQLDSLGLFILCACIFMPLAMLIPSRRDQPVIHKGMLPDILYWFLAGRLIYIPIGQIMGQALLYLLVTLGIYSISTAQYLSHGIPPLSTLPVLLQAFLILLIMDFFQYWLHRMFHTMKLWKFHAIHHSAINVDWLTSARFHPINILVYSTSVYVVVSLMGFSPEAWIVLAPFNMIYSPLVHANVNWTYGPFRYFLASPTFHRWHHTYIEEGGNKNFAPTFPFLDIIFGTYYDPKDIRPTVFGTPYDNIADGNILQQFIYPFRKRPRVGRQAVEREIKGNPVT